MSPRAIASNSRTLGVLPRLHVVTDDVVLARRDFGARARDVLAAGGGRVALHLRGPRTSGARMYDIAAELLDAARAAGATLLANDRIDLALVADLAGVHLRERSLPPEVARRLLPPRRLVGLSIHSEEEARAARKEADYLVVGTVFATATHPDQTPGGLDLVRRASLAAHRPVLGIGGVTRDRVEAVRAAGAHGVAVVGGIWGATDPAEAVAGYLDRLR
jgi:thiamine-phosphate pyrophosphorylase